MADLGGRHCERFPPCFPRSVVVSRPQEKELDVAGGWGRGVGANTLGLESKLTCFH